MSNIFLQATDILGKKNVQNGFNREALTRLSRSQLISCVYLAKGI